MEYLSIHHMHTSYHITYHHQSAPLSSEGGRPPCPQLHLTSAPPHVLPPAGIMGTGALSGRNRSCGHDLGSHTRCCAFWNSVHRSARVLHGPDRTSLYLRLPSHTPPYNAYAGLALSASTRQISETLEIRLSKVGAAEGDSSRIILAPPPTHIRFRSFLVST